MAKDVKDTLRDALGQAVREAIGSVGSEPEKPKRGAFSGGKGLLAGAGLAAAAPLAKKGLDALQDGSLDEMIAGLRERVEAAGQDDDQAESDEPTAAGDHGEPDEDDGDEADEQRGGGGGPQATGKGRRMPIQQAVDVGVPLETAYNQFTQFEDWPQFMHRVTRVTQEDEATISFATKIWGKTKEFTAKIDTQRPDERVKWKVSQGITHAGVVTFHELAPNLTRIEVTLDVDPGSLLEKAARGMRHIKRAVRADLARFKAFVEMRELETGAWRGVIEGGEVVEPHDDSYDEERDYSDIEDEDPSASADEPADDEEQAEDEEDQETVAASDEDEGDTEEQPRARPKREHGRRTRSRDANGRGRSKPVGSDGERRRRSRAG
jgi:uncharacterized membrane protein